MRSLVITILLLGLIDFSYAKYEESELVECSDMELLINSIDRKIELLEVDYSRLLAEVREVERDLDLLGSEDEREEYTENYGTRVKDGTFEDPETKFTEWKELFRANSNSLTKIKRELDVIDDNLYESKMRREGMIYLYDRTCL